MAKKLPKKRVSGIAGAGAPQLGRKRDPSRDAEILDAALDVLVEVGYDGMTMDQVAAKAKAGKGAMYRRWPSKTELVIEAVSYMKRRSVDSADLPDTGTLRGDLLSLYKPQSVEQSERKLKIMAGLFSLVLHNKALGDAVEDAISKPWVEVQKVLLKRSVARKEIRFNFDIDVVAKILPAAAIYQTLVLRKTFDKKVLTATIDEVLLPALKSK
ncbi:MAG: TetR/AcrR family transcriptional regulator [Proteobacteria bacterium]|nr:MAG: TetR/AcrR family transcriptional regulator [Pseudomonadota bacterium]